MSEEPPLPAPNSSTAAARGRAPARTWVHLTHGIHLSPGADRRDALLGWQLLLPDAGCFTHVTAAELRGWWLPPVPSSCPVFVSVGQDDPRPLRTGIRTIRLERPVVPATVDGLRVAPPLEILVAAARDLGLVDLVVLLDGAAYIGDVDLDELRLVVSELRSRRGLPALRRALALADQRSESPWETLLRLLHVVCGIEVEPQFEVPGPYGPLARADLLVVGSRTLHEYDGEVHLPRARQKKDLRRLRRLDAADWSRHGFVAEDVLSRAVGILRDADAAVGRDHDPTRIRAWHDLLRESLFTPTGQARLLGRLGHASRRHRGASVTPGGPDAAC
jgi:hypothetical protein